MEINAKHMSPINLYTVLLPVYNEETRVEHAIRNFRGRAEIVVIDNFSTDRTAEIAESLGAKVVRRKSGVVTADFYKFMFSHVSTDWFWLIFAGHYCPLDLIETCEEAMKCGRYDAVALQQIHIQYGRKTLAYGLNRQWKLDTTRLAKVSAIDLSRHRIHVETPVACDDSRVFYVPLRENLFIKNFRDDDLEMMNSKTNRYAQEESAQFLAAGRSTSFARIIIRFVFDLLKRLIWRRALFEGSPGMIIAVAQSYQQFCVQAMLWERQNKCQFTDMRLRNQAVREEILKSTGR